MRPSDLLGLVLLIGWMLATVIAAGATSVTRSRWCLVSLLLLGAFVTVRLLTKQP